MKRMISLVIAIAMLVTLSTFVHANEEASTAIVLKDIENHWGAVDIQEAVNKGYVNGYSDLTFKPNNPVTRAEFIKMAVVALGIDYSQGSDGTKWYEAYVNAAITHKYISSTEYSTGNYNTQMTREEMAAVAVRAIGLTAKSKEEYMYVAASKGLITGVGNGQLAADKTTTRAQSVSIIERIIRVQKGEQLPVDAAAVANAEKAMNAPKDPWGRAIRTTNLPKNYKDFPYILEQWPNAMYELKLDSLEETAAEVQKSDYNQQAVAQWAQKVEAWGNHLLNVDYHTIDQNWAEGYLEHILNPSENSAKKYITKVKENKIQIEGKLQVEPSIVQLASGTYHIRVYYKFRILTSNTDEFVIDDMYYKTGVYKKNTWYEGYADVKLSTNVLQGTWHNYKVSSLASIFKQGNAMEIK
ncbi:S-layer homology domain-containing protein [Paenibacillus harenae]|uniref:SLH domain-containing protein n=1 Tax=Paenibacillus harenae TaxID=306543 RepID=A0ABT9TTI6_PAEHA|nr:S-layer homology domain-containing protein [Paenibacillus harenae]MDQ0110646.1 hypothetical protein [Paenibacillus harenae]